MSYQKIESNQFEALYGIIDMTALKKEMKKRTCKTSQMLPTMEVN